MRKGIDRMREREGKRELLSKFLEVKFHLKKMKWPPESLEFEWYFARVERILWSESSSEYFYSKLKSEFDVQRVAKRHNEVGSSANCHDVSRRNIPLIYCNLLFSNEFFFNDRLTDKHPTRGARRLLTDQFHKNAANYRPFPMWLICG